MWANACCNARDISPSNSFPKFAVARREPRAYASCFNLSPRLCAARREANTMPTVDVSSHTAATSGSVRHGEVRADSSRKVG